jgi:hypothetical protein
MWEIGIRFLLLVVLAASPAPTFAASRSDSLITINVPVAYMVLYVIVLSHLGPKKSRFSGPKPSNAPSNWFARLKTIRHRAI